MVSVVMFMLGCLVSRFGDFLLFTIYQIYISLGCHNGFVLYHKTFYDKGPFASDKCCLNIQLNSRKDYLYSYTLKKAQSCMSVTGVLQYSMPLKISEYRIVFKIILVWNWKVNKEWWTVRYVKLVLNHHLKSMNNLPFQK